MRKVLTLFGKGSHTGLYAMLFCPAVPLHTTQRLQHGQGFIQTTDPTV